MGKEIVINAEEDITRIAIVEDGELGELHFENPENERTIGDIYLGRIRRVMPSIRAAFVDVGQEQDAFLHFSDLSDNLQDLLQFVQQKNPRVDENVELSKSSGTGRGGRSRSYNQQKHLNNGQRILVKITKEPISNKGSRVSTNISLAGRFLVLVPLADYTAVSKKINSHKERRRLRALAKSLLPPGFGIIVRTVAEGRDAKSLDTDLNLLLDKWRRIEKNLKGKPSPPVKVHEDVGMASSIIRDLFSQDFDRILVDQPTLYRKIRSYVQAVAPQMAQAVQLHKDRSHVFTEMGVDEDIEEVFDSRVELPSGGYLFVEQTEAMHVVDVNSGRSGKGMSQEENSLRVNLEAARIIARQIRLRDLGGIIVIDFIDMRSDKNNQKVYDALQEEFAKDRAVTKVLPMSDFGVMQITRQRLRPSLTTTFSGPDVNGSSDDKEASSRETQKSRADKRSAAEAKRASADRSRGREQQKQKRQPSRKQQAKQQGRGNGRSSPSSARRSQGRAAKNQGQKAPSERRSAAPARERSATAAAPKRSPQELLQEIEQWIAAYRKTGQRRSLTLRVHPFTAAYLNRKVPTYPTRWFMKHLLRVRLDLTEEVAPTAYAFIDPGTGTDVTDTVSHQTS